MQNTLDSQGKTHSSAARSQQVVVASPDGGRAYSTRAGNEAVLSTTQACCVPSPRQRKEVHGLPRPAEDRVHVSSVVFPGARLPNTQVQASCVENKLLRDAMHWLKWTPLRRSTRAMGTRALREGEHRYSIPEQIARHARHREAPKPSSVQK